MPEAGVTSRSPLRCRLLLLEPCVPEERKRRRAEVTPQLLTDHGQAVQMSELDLPHVFVKESLDAVDDVLALPCVRFAGQFDKQPLLLFEAPPSGELRDAVNNRRECRTHDGERRLVREDVEESSGLSQLWPSVAKSSTWRSILKPTSSSCCLATSALL